MSAPDGGLLLDEHYPPRLGAMLLAAGIDAICVANQPALQGLPDQEILIAAKAGNRVLITEHVNTMPAAMDAVPDHAGVVFASPRAFRRDPAGIASLADAIIQLLSDPPVGFGSPGYAGWLRRPQP